MIDTARHYLPIDVIFETLDAMMLNKMNILHWHIVDDESFPLYFEDFPEICTGPPFYNYKNVRQIIEYAKSRGIQIIPEIDTPGHTLSWRKHYEDVVIPFGLQYGMFDPTLNKTYEVVTQVLKQIQQLFHDSPYIHMGGDEVRSQYWDQRPEIKEFMQLHKIANYTELQSYYRKREKQIWRKEIGSKINLAYWANSDINLPVDDDDLIQWWGKNSDLMDIKDNKGKIVLSNSDTVYLNHGFGNAFGNIMNNTYSTWKDIYLNYNPILQGIKGKVIGGEACLWSEVNSGETQMTKLFIRASVVAEILWNPQEKTSIKQFARKLVAMEKRLISYGFECSPVTSEYCARNIDICFN